MGAWLGLTAAITLWRAIGHHAMWPENLNFAVGTVLAVFVGSKVSVGMRDAKAKDWGTAPPKPLPQAPDPVGVGDAAKKESAQGEPKREKERKEPESPQEPTEPKAPKRPVSRESVNPQAAAVAKALDHFQTPDYAKELGVDEDTARGHIGVLIRAGLLHNEGHGWFKWTGD